MYIPETKKHGQEIGCMDPHPSPPCAHTQKRLNFLEMPSAASGKLFRLLLQCCLPPKLLEWKRGFVK